MMFHATPLQWVLLQLWRVFGYPQWLTRAITRSLSSRQEAELRHAYARHRVEET